MSEQRISLDVIQTYAQHAMSRRVLDRLPSGMHDPKLRVLTDMVVDALIFQMTAFVLGEDAGPKTQDWVRWLAPIRPWWMPKFLWRRIPTRPVEYELSVQPQWIYPSSEVNVPRLGPKVEIATTSGPYRYEEDDDE